MFPRGLENFEGREYGAGAPRMATGDRKGYFYVLCSFICFVMSFHVMESNCKESCNKKCNFIHIVLLKVLIRSMGQKL